MLVLWFAGRGGGGIQRLTVKEAGWDETGGEVCRAVGGLAPSLKRCRLAEQEVKYYGAPGPCTLPLARLQALASGTGQAKATQSSDIVEPDGC